MMYKIDAIVAKNFNCNTTKLLHQMMRDIYQVRVDRSTGLVQNLLRD